MRAAFHPDSCESCCAVSPVQRLTRAQMRAQLVPADIGQQRRPVLAPLPSAYEDQPLIEVDVLHPELAAFRHAGQRVRPDVVRADPGGAGLDYRLSATSWALLKQPDKLEAAERNTGAGLQRNPGDRSGSGQYAVASAPRFDLTVIEQRFRGGARCEASTQGG